MAGAFAGAILVWLHFLPHWEQTPDQGSNSPASAQRGDPQIWRKPDQ
jgi:hypothetical protein